MLHLPFNSRLDADASVVRWAAIEALGTPSPWPREILQVLMCLLDNRDWTMGRK
ncbi:hypothetical protein V8F44DRAFT_616147 [Aspergillus fumigatus]